MDSPIDHARIIGMARTDFQYFKCEVYEMIGDASCYVPQDLCELFKHFAEEDKTLRQDVMLFKNVRPHTDQMPSKGVYLVHAILHGQGTFKSAGESIPVRPGMVFAMNPLIEHSFETDENVITFCMEKQHVYQ